MLTAAMSLPPKGGGEGGDGFFGEDSHASNSEYGMGGGWGISRQQSETSNGSRPKANTNTNTNKKKQAIERAEEHVLHKQRLHQRFFQVLTDIELLLEKPAGVDKDLDDVKNGRRSSGLRPVSKVAGDATSSRKGEQSQVEDMEAGSFFNPTGPRLIAWDTFVIAVILYSVFQVPLRIGFMSNMPTPPGELAWNYVVDAVFFLDILVAFNVPFFERLTDAFVLDRGRIARRYLSCWFWIDLAAALPLDDMVSAAVSGTSTSPAQLRSVKLIRILRLTRLGKLHKLTKYGAVRDALDERNISPAFLNFITLVLQVVLFAHLVACFWWFITTADATGVMQPLNPPTDDAFVYPLRTWATQFHLQYASVASQYIASLYFTFMTLFTVGYGDIHATNTGERFYCILIEFAAAILFSAVIARVRAVVDSQNLNVKALRTKMEDFKAYLEEKKVNATLKHLAKEAYAFYLNKVPTLGEHGFYEELPKMSKHKFVQHKFMREIRHIHLFRNSDIAFISDIIVHSKPQQATVGEVIYGVGDYAEEMAFLMKGSVRLLDMHGTTNVNMGYASSGGYFGDFEYLKRGQRVAKYQAAQNCTLFTIGYNRFDNAFAEHDEHRVRMMRKFKRRLDVYNEVKYSPFLRGKMLDFLGRMVRTNSLTNAPGGGASGSGSAPIPGGGFVTDAGVGTPMLVHDRIWSDGEVDLLFAPEDVGGEHGATAKEAQTLMQRRVRTVDQVYFQMAVKRGGHTETEELTLDYIAKQRLFFPQQPRKMAWDAFIGVLIIYSVLVIPMQIGFPAFSGPDGNVGQSALYFEYAMDFIFLFDMAAAFNTAYYSADDDAYVTIRPLIAQNYLRTWFTVDLLSTVPWDLVLSAATAGESGNAGVLVQLVKTLRLLRIFKLFKIFNVARLTNFFEDRFGVSAALFNLTDMFLRIVFVSHLVACLYWGLTSEAMGDPHWFNSLSHAYETLGEATFQVLHRPHFQGNAVNTIFFSASCLTSPTVPQLLSLLFPTPLGPVRGVHVLGDPDPHHHGLRRPRAGVRQRAHLGHGHSGHRGDRLLLRDCAHFRPHPELQPSRGPSIAPHHGDQGIPRRSARRPRVVRRGHGALQASDEAQLGLRRTRHPPAPADPCP